MTSPAPLWLVPWFVTDEMSLVAELRREMGRDHVLTGLPLRVVARRQDCDDVLFEICDDSERVAVVHLTYANEIDSRWPKTELYRSFDHFCETRMRADHLEFADSDE